MARGRREHRVRAVPLQLIRPLRGDLRARVQRGTRGRIFRVDERRRRRRMVMLGMGQGEMGGDGGAGRWWPTVPCHDCAAAAATVHDATGFAERGLRSPRTPLVLVVLVVPCLLR